MKKICLTLAAFALASVAMAQLSKYKDWPKSPEADFLTPSERSDWQSVKSDDDAEKFIASYYAKRGGDRFKAEVARRIAAADEQFKLRRVRGAESNRGRLLIVLGLPTRVTNSRVTEDANSPAPGPGPGIGTGTAGNPANPGLGAGNGQLQVWYYDHSKFDPSIGLPDLNARVLVDLQRGTDDLQNASEINRAIAQVAEKSIVNPSGPGTASSAVPSPAAAAPGPPASSLLPPGAPSASSGAPPPGGNPSVRPVVPSAATGAGGSVGTSTSPAGAPAASIPAATRSSLDAVFKSAPGGPGTDGFWGGTFRSVPGDPFYSVELAVPADKAAGGVKFAGVVTSDSGQEVASYWEDATLMEMKSGTRSDKVYERSIVLPPGSYRGAFALFTPDGTTPLASGSARFDLTPKGTALEVSPLILASTLTPLTKRPSPTDPFVFGMDKPIRVDPKGSHLFGRDESLWYFYTVTNPAVAAAPATATPAPAPSPAGVATAAPAAEAAPRPRIMATIGVLRDGRPAFAPNTAPAEMQMLSPGYYATGSEIPLATFEPGFYTFTLRVRDMNAPRESAAFTGVDRKEDFVVLKPDGTLPEKAVAKQPTPKPRAPGKK